MAAGQSDYHRGEMETDAQEGTFKGFMGITVYGGAAIALIVFMPVLVFGVGMGWLPALIATLLLGVVMGLALKLKGGWYAAIIASGILVGILCAIISALM
ncbi:aa3-type cytochrome c oxidase subunit IV [Litorimonas sp. RW-G-Af-16]|uniref:aa3-type cytochrome c oxidase subunit IV n=1 Tax=Litorimonas sp. RW-G-Af-16 TaxID=3241168 RepID=UPI00390CD39D